MKKSYLLTLFTVLTILIFASTDLKAQKENKNFGLGVMLGEPSGVSVKKWFSEKTAFDIGAAWSLEDFQTLHLHSDFLIHSELEGSENLLFYYGIGGRIIFADDPNIGVRIPIGLNYVFENAPFDLFVEAVPILDIAPDVALAGNGAVGIRYYF